MTDTTAIATPKPGDEVTLTLTVITADLNDGAHWGRNLKVSAKVAGIEGVHYGDLRLTVDRDHPWFGKMMGRALDRIQNPQPEEDPADAERPDDQPTRTPPVGGVPDDAPAPKPAPKKRTPRKTKIAAA